MRTLTIFILAVLFILPCLGNNDRNESCSHNSSNAIPLGNNEKKIKTAEYLTRYGHRGIVTEENFDKIAGSLINELRNEKFRWPDDEHTQVSIGTDSWFVTAQVSGLVTLGNYDKLAPNDPVPRNDLHMRDIPDCRLKEIWRAVLLNDIKKVRTYKWVELDRLPKFKSHYYRKKKTIETFPAWNLFLKKSATVPTRL